MMKKMIMLSCLFSPFSFATQTLFDPIISSTSKTINLSNPASGYLMTDNTYFNFGLFVVEPLAAGYELGDVDSLLDELDDLESILTDGVSSAAEAAAAEEKFDAFLEKAGEDGYIKASGAGSVILFPLLYQNEKYGALSLDFTYGSLYKYSVLDDPDGVTVSGTTLTTDSSVYQQTLKASTFGLGYRHSLMSSHYGDLIVGAKLNLSQVNLYRNVSTIENLGEFEDEGEATSVNVGADVGILWVTDNMRLGVTVSNLNEPKYDLGELGNCTGLSGVSLTNCEASVTFADYGDIELSGYYVAEKQVTAQFALALASNALSIQSSYDFNSIEDATGDEYQWAEVSVNYLSDSYLLPGMRLGLKKNMAGSELSYVNAGMTLFKYLNFDFGTTLDFVDIYGFTVPRSAYINLGLVMAI
jgi:hypothetical protein